MLKQFKPLGTNAGYQNIRNSYLIFKVLGEIAVIGNVEVHEDIVSTISKDKSVADPFYEFWSVISAVVDEYLER